MPEGSVVSFVADRDVPQEELKNVSAVAADAGLIAEYELDETGPSPSMPDLVYPLARYPHDSIPNPYIGGEHLQYSALTQGIATNKARTLWGLITNNFALRIAYDRNKMGRQLGEHTYAELGDATLRWTRSELDAVIRPEWAHNHPEDFEDLSANFFVSFRSLRDGIKTRRINEIRGIGVSKVGVLSLLVDGLIQE